MKYIIFEKKDSIGIIKLNNPTALNALKKDLLNELDRLVSELYSDRNLKVLIITGEGGKAFAAGSDIKELQNMDNYQAKEYSEFGNRLMDKIENFPVPVIAAINGYALGGGLELVLSTDFAYASENAVMGLPELKLGVIPGFGGCKRLLDRIGTEKAKELVYTSRMITAAEAAEYGLVNRVVKEENLMDEVLKTAGEIQRLSPNAVRESKELLNACRNSTHQSVKVIETNKFGLIFSHEEAASGIAAFINKTKK